MAHLTHKFLIAVAPCASNVAFILFCKSFWRFSLLVSRHLFGRRVSSQSFAPSTKRLMAYLAHINFSRDLATISARKWSKTECKRCSCSLTTINAPACVRVHCYVCVCVFFSSLISNFVRFIVQVRMRRAYAKCLITHFTHYCSGRCAASTTHMSSDESWKLMRALHFD